MIDLHGVQPGGRVTSWTAFCDSTRRDWPGRFSRDGTQVTFTSDRDGPARAYVASQDGSRLRTVTDIEGTSVGSAAWSPDGRSLVFDAVDRENLNDLFVTGIEGGPLIRLTHDDQGEINPEWSRDGGVDLLRIERVGSAGDLEDRRQQVERRSRSPRREAWTLASLRMDAASIFSNPPRAHTRQARSKG